MKKALFSGVVLVAIASAVMSLRPPPAAAPKETKVEQPASVTTYDTAVSELAATVGGSALEKSWGRDRWVR